MVDLDKEIRILVHEPTTEALKKRFKALAKRFHPDSAQENLPGEAFSRLKSAYDQALARRQAAEDLGPDGKFGVFFWGGLLVDGKTPMIRSMAAEKLGKFQRLSAYGFLKQALSDPEEEVVCQVLKALAQLPVSQASGDLAGLYFQASRRVKMEILHTCARLASHNSGYLNVLQTAQGDPDISIRKTASNLLNSSIS